jgi:hypothetical protein
VSAEAWPPLPLADWKDTYHALHMWTQMVGKLQLALTPLTNHWWNVTLHVTAGGLTTLPMPIGPDVSTVAFDFVDHVLRIDTSRGERREIPLAPQPVAQLYERFMAALGELGIPARIWPMPVEVPDRVRFDRDTTGAYDRDAARRCWRILFETDAVLKEFRARFIGKCSPVSFLLGRLRSGGDTLLRAAGAAAAGRGRDDPRGLLPRGEQRGMVAGRRGH